MKTKFLLFLLSLMIAETYAKFDQPCGAVKQELQKCREYFGDKIVSHPAWRLPYWKKYLEKDVKDRVFIADKKLVEMIHLQNLK